MKKHICLLLVMLLVLGTLPGCQQTPKEPIVVGKSNELMIEKAQETPSSGTDAMSLREKTQAPETLSYDLTKKNVTVNTHAEVTVPDGHEMSIVRVKAGDFSQGQITALWEELVGNTEMFYTSTDMTKPEIQAAIIAVNGYIVKTDDEEDKARFQAQLDYFNSIYDIAPESRSLIPIDGKLQVLYLLEYGSDKKTEYSGVLAFNADGSMRFTASNSYKDTNGTHDAMFEFHRSIDKTEPEGQPEIERQDIDVSEEAIPYHSGNLEMSPYAAKQKVEAFLSNANIPFAVASGTLNNNNEIYYYSFFCTRVVADIPSALILGGSYHEDTQTGYAKVWNYEVFSITVDNAGIRSVRWDAPVEIIENVVDNSALMPFANIKVIFDKMMFVNYEFQAQGVAALLCEVTDVKLETIRILEQNADNFGLLVPVWNFYGTKTSEYEGGTKSTSSKIILMCINAIDGSIIDVSTGY